MSRDGGNKINYGTPYNAASAVQELEKKNGERINEINQLTTQSRDIEHKITTIDDTVNKLIIDISDLQTQNQNQADIITAHTNSLNQQAIEVSALKEQNSQLLKKISKLEHILCSYVDCNAPIIGEVEPGTDGYN